VAELTDIVDGEWRSELTLWVEGGGINWMWMESGGVNRYCRWRVADSVFE